jgi:hypothetical protein
MKPWLSKSAAQLREQVDDTYPDRNRKSDGWLASMAHVSRAPKSDHNPDPKTACVRAIDISIGLSDDKRLPAYLADQIRLFGKNHGRISYVIFEEKIASPLLNWKWRKYKGINPHKRHIHISFTTLGDLNGTAFDIPLIGGKI